MVKREQLPASLGNLQLQLAETEFIPGATLTGTVTLTLSEPVESAVLSVKIEGVQKVEWLIMGPRSDRINAPVKAVKHLDVEDVLGELNGTLLPGVHVLPFASKLPPDLLSSTKIKRVVEKLPEKPRVLYFGVDYSVSAKLEAAGLSSLSLQKTCPFFVLPTPTTSPSTRPAAVKKEEEIRPVFGLGRSKACSIELQLTSDVVDIVTGVIEADVQIQLPTNVNVHHVHLVLYEDVNLKVSKNYDEGGEQDPRIVCRQTYNAKHFTSVHDNISDPTKLLSGRLELKITDPKAKFYGPLVPFLASQPLDISHRVGVEISFLLGSRVSMSVPVTLIKVVAEAPNRLEADTYWYTQGDL